MATPLQTAYQAHSFPQFTSLPPELRLRIYSLSLPSRTLEIRLTPKATPPRRDPSHDRRFLTTPALPALFHVSREARHSALALYKPCEGDTFHGTKAWPWNLWNPATDTLYLLQSLYVLRAVEVDVMYSAAAAAALGSPRPFVMDWLAGERWADVAEVERLGIVWNDMHLEDVRDLTRACRKWPRLRELILVFTESARHGRENMAVQRVRRRIDVVLVEGQEDVDVSGRYMQRLVSDKKLLVESLNKELRDEEVRLAESGVCWRAPRLSVQMARYLDGRVTV